MTKFTTILFCTFILTISSLAQKNLQHSSVNIKSISPFVDLLTVSVVDTAVAWIGGNDENSGVVFRTVNGGRDWGVDLFPHGYNVFNIFGVDVNTALIAVSGIDETAIFRTVDGGGTWNNVFSSPGFINSVHMVSPSDGYAVRDPVGGQWSILKTQNGGLNWNIFSSFASIGSEYGYNNCVSWLGPSRGWFGTSGGRVYYTMNGGFSWDYAATPFDTVTAVAFPSDVGLSASSRGDIAGSINNGQDWFYLTNMSERWVTGLSGVNLPSLTVWWAVSGMDFFATVDSGLTWFTIASAPDNLYHVDMKFIPPQNSIIGWAVGKSGNVIRYKCTYPEMPTSPSPSTHSAGVSPMVTLRWSEAINCGYYYLEVSNDPGFDTPNLLFADVVNTNSKTIGPLARNTKYYWKVFAENLLGYELSEIWDFTVKGDTSFSINIPFPSNPTASTDYRLFSVPGITAPKVSDILKSGNQKTDWRIYRDHGSEPFVPEELSGISTLGIGEGYWLIKRGSLDISSYNTIMPPLSFYNEYVIDLHNGWNIIGNPFDRAVYAESIKTSNGLSSFTLYQYDGLYTQSSVMEPFRGYYYFNGPTPLDSLAIPFPYVFGNALNNISRTDWQVQLILETDINRDPENFIGISPNAKLDLDEFDNRKPPLVFDQGFLYFSRPEWDSKYSRFGSDVRPLLGEGQVWDFEVSNPRKSKGTIRFHGIEQIPSEYDAILINTHNSIPFDLRSANEYTYPTVSEKMLFKLIVGKKLFIGREQSKYIPAQYSLMQNYPNPFNPTTSISYSIPHEADVRLEIFSVLGDRVAILAEGRHTPAVYTVVWDGTDLHGNPVASGVYFYQLVAKGSLIQTKKMLLTR